MRLACAHAKLMFREVVCLQDSIVAVACICSSQMHLQHDRFLGSIVAHQNLFKYDFSVNPDEDYIILEGKILSALHCSKGDLENSRLSRKRSRTEVELSRNLDGHHEHVAEQKYGHIEDASLHVKNKAPNHQIVLRLMKSKINSILKFQDNSDSNIYNIKSSTEIATDSSPFQTTESLRRRHLVSLNDVNNGGRLLNGIETADSLPRVNVANLLEENDW